MTYRPTQAALDAKLIAPGTYRLVADHPTVAGWVEIVKDAAGAKPLTVSVTLLESVPGIVHKM